MKITKQQLKQIIREGIEALTEEELDVKRVPKASRPQTAYMMPNSLLRRLGFGGNIIHDKDDIWVLVSDSDLDSIPDRLRRKYRRKK